MGARDTEMEGVTISRIVSHEVQTAELIDGKEGEANLRPATFDTYPGQEKAKENLKVYVGAARKRNVALDHVILHGPPGLGKTTLARIIAHELGAPFYQTSGPSLDKPGDLAGILAGLEPGSVLFIDEIHRLSIAVEEVLYSAMEDFHMDIVVGQGPTARSVRMPINRFTMIGATTRVSLLSSPLLSRFGIQERLEFYSEASLQNILQRSAELLGLELEGEAGFEIARRARGTPRVANRLLKRARDFSEFHGQTSVTAAMARLTLDRLEIDAFGLDGMDRRILKAIFERYAGGPVGLDTLAATIGEDRTTIEDVYEPFLVYRGFIARGARGRELTEKGRLHAQKALEEEGLE